MPSQKDIDDLWEEVEHLKHSLAKWISESGTKHNKLAARVLELDKQVKNLREKKRG